MQSIKFIPKHATLIFTLFQVGCSTTINKLGMKKEAAFSCNNTIQQKYAESFETDLFFSILFDAAKIGDLNSLKIGIELMPLVIHIRDIYGASMLHYAVQSKSTDCIEFLLKNGADVNAIDKRNNTILHWTIRERNMKIVKMLLKVDGIEVNKQDQIGMTPLHWAAKEGRIEIVKMLLTVRDIDVNKQNQMGMAPLHWASCLSSTEIVKMLLKVDDIEVNKQDQIGMTPLHWAAKEGRIEIVKILLEVDGIEVNKQDPMEMTPLHWAAREGHMEIVKMLLTVNKMRESKRNKRKYPY